MLDPIRSMTLSALVCVAALGCDPTPPDEPGDPIDAPLWGKTDGGCPSPQSPAAAGVLELVNDASTTMELLDRPTSDGGVGLDRRAAQGIIDARPLGDLQALDAVPYVGPAACRALADRACNEDGRCQAPLRVATWNLRHFPLTEATTTVVPQYVEELALDVVGLQEVGDTDAFDELLDALPGYSGFLAESGPFTRVGLIVRDSAVEVLDVRSEFVDDGWAFPRPVLVVDAEIPGARQSTTMSFVVVHLKARVDDTSRQRRLSAVEKLRDFVDQQREQEKGAMVLLGDWNDSLTDPAPWNVFEPLLDEEAEATFVTLPAAQQSIDTLIPFEVTIDHVMVTNETFDLIEGEQTEVLLLDEEWPEYTDVVSDHRPVLTTFSIAHSYP